MKVRIKAMLLRYTNMEWLVALHRRATFATSLFVAIIYNALSGLLNCFDMSNGAKGWILFGATVLVLVSHIIHLKLIDRAFMKRYNAKLEERVYEFNEAVMKGKILSEDIYSDMKNACIMHDVKKGENKTKGGG
jgi:hypothetical protein